MSCGTAKRVHGTLVQRYQGCGRWQAAGVGPATSRCSSMHTTSSSPIKRILFQVHLLEEFACGCGQVGRGQPT